MPQHVFHDISLHIVSHTKKDKPLERAARDDVSGRNEENRRGSREPLKPRAQKPG